MSGFTTNGLFADAAGHRPCSSATASSATTGDLVGHQATGILVTGAVQFEMADSRADGNDTGFSVEGDARGSILRSAASRNRSNGFEFFIGPVVAATDVVADGNGANGVIAFGEAVSRPGRGSRPARRR